MSEVPLSPGDGGIAELREEVGAEEIEGFGFRVSGSGFRFSVFGYRV